MARTSRLLLLSRAESGRRAVVFGCRGSSHGYHAPNETVILKAVFGSGLRAGDGAGAEVRRKNASPRILQLTDTHGWDR
jgi:hypothetical protein